MLLIFVKLYFVLVMVQVISSQDSRGRQTVCTTIQHIGKCGFQILTAKRSDLLPSGLNAALITIDQITVEYVTKTPM